MPSSAQAKLLQDEGELRRMIDAIAQTIIVLNPDGKAIYANRVALDYTGLSLDEVRADNFRERVFHPEDVERLRKERQERSLRLGSVRKRAAGSQERRQISVVSYPVQPFHR
jgi:PAS domain S-box-containing protein